MHRFSLLPRAYVYACVRVCVYDRVERYCRQELDLGANRPIASGLAAHKLLHAATWSLVPVRPQPSVLRFTVRASFVLRYSSLLSFFSLIFFLVFMFFVFFYKYIYSGAYILSIPEDMLGGVGISIPEDMLGGGRSKVFNRVGGSRPH